MGDGLPCDGKVRYSSGPAARRELSWIRRGRRNHDGATKPKRVYPCPHCHGWHATSQDYRPNQEWQ